MSYFNSITQNVTEDAINTSIDLVSLDPGEIFNNNQATGTSTLGVAGIQVNLMCDQDCDVYVDQSMDNSNWDITDTYTYVTHLGGNSWTVQATASYVRVRVKNLGAIATSVFRLQTALCPIVDSVPRSLDDDGFLKVGIWCTHDDETGYEARIDQYNTIKTGNAIRIVGRTFNGTTKDTNFWTETVTGSGSVSQSSGSVNLVTGATANSTVKYSSVTVARFVPGSSNIYRGRVKLSHTGTANNISRWGMYDTNDGLFFELTGTTFNIVTRYGGVDTKIPVSSWSEIRRFSMDTNFHTYEIWAGLRGAQFFIDNNVVHSATVDGSSSLLTETLNVPINIENNNSNGSVSNLTLTSPMQIILRLGGLTTQPRFRFQSGTTAGIVLKYGPGNLHRMILSSITSGSTITLYDNTAANGTMLWQGTISFGNQGGPGILPIDFGGVSFSAGLTLVIATQNSNALVIYE
jgi:hypothetical protein